MTANKPIVAVEGKIVDIKDMTIRHASTYIAGYEAGRSDREQGLGYKAALEESYQRAKSYIHAHMFARAYMAGYDTKD